jgi:hypothetical protein
MAADDGDLLLKATTMLDFLMSVFAGTVTSAVLMGCVIWQLRR